MDWDKLDESTLAHPNCSYSAVDPENKLINRETEEENTIIDEVPP